MAIKRKLTIAVFFLILGLSVLGCLVSVVYFIIPSFVESQVIPKLAADLGLSDYTFGVRRIHYKGMDFAPVTVSADGFPGLSIGSVRIDYSPLSLYRGNIDRVAISGITVNAAYQNGVFTIPGLPIDGWVAKTPSEPSGSEKPAQLPPFHVGVLDIQHARIKINRQGSILSLPLTMKITPENRSMSQIRIAMNIDPRDSRLSVMGTIDRDKSSAEVSFASPQMDPARFRDLANLAPSTTVHGHLDINGQAVLNLSPFKLSSFSATAACRNLRIRQGSASLSNAVDEKDRQLPVNLALQYIDSGEWHVSVANLALKTPLPVILDQLEGPLKISRNTMEYTGKLSGQIGPFIQRGTVPIHLKPIKGFEGHFSISRAESDQWAVTALGNQEQAKQSKQSLMGLSLNDIKIRTQTPAWVVSGSSKGGIGNLSLRMSFPALNAAWGRRAASLAGLSLKAAAKFNNASEAFNFDAEFNLAAKKLQAKLADQQVTIPELSVKGQLQGNKNGPGAITAVWRLINADLKDKKNGIRIKGINARLPLHWPFDGRGAKGRVAITDAGWRDKSLGPVNTSVRQQDRRLNFFGSHTNKILPNLKLQFDGALGLGPTGRLEMRTQFRIPSYQPEQPLDIGRFLPSAKDLKITGKLDLAGDITLDSRGLQSSLKTTLSRGTLSRESEQLEMSDINVSVSIPDLIRLRSEPAQTIRFGKARLGGFSLDQGKVEFQIESARSLLVEKSSFKWCGGHVDAHAIRVSPEKKNYELVFYCDRLILSQILEQFGAVLAEGEGKVNGKLPLDIRNGRLLFKDGFLYSSPGEGGSIRLTGTESLTAGIPPDSMQYAQLELAREALKDYTYKWVKLGLNTEGETLLLRMQMDGKPAKPLPFVYNKQLGGFSRVKAGSKGSIFQGISLDVNFKLPLDKILRYSDLFQNIN